MKIYVLSLKDSPRRKSFEEDNYFLSKKYIFSNAIDGKLLSNDYISSINKLTKRYKRNIGRNEIACADSHIAIYKNMIKNNIEWALIFEDDIIIDEKISKLITYNKNKLDRMYLYILGGQEGLSSREMIITSQKDIITISDNFEFKKTIASSKYIYRTCCYLVHRQLVEKIVALREKYFFLADDWNFLYKKNVIKNFYITDCAKHPEELNNSILQNERDIHKKNNFILKLKNGKLRTYKIKLRKIIYGQ